MAFMLLGADLLSRTRRAGRQVRLGRALGELCCSETIFKHWVDLHD